MGRANPGMFCRVCRFDCTWTVSTIHNRYLRSRITPRYSPNEPNIQTYEVYGACASEILLDVLTGQYLITRVDLLEDTGQSMSPVIDIGQIEGAFVMGMGYHTTEQIVYSYEGRLLTNRTWNYYPPGARDIPIHFNVKFPKNNPNPVGVLKSKGMNLVAFIYC